MPFKLTHHDSKYFHAQGTKGPFKIAKRGLGKGQHDKYLAMCDGGVVPKKMAKGGEVDAMTGAGPTQEDVNRQAADLGNATGRAVAGFVSPRANSIGAAGVAGVRSLLPGGRSYDEEFERYNRDAGARSVVHPPFNSTADRMKWGADPENPDNIEAREAAMMFALGTAKKGKAPKAGTAPASAAAGRSLQEIPAPASLKEARSYPNSVDWRTMPPEVGQAAAAEGRGLAIDPKTGDIIGAPPGDRTMAHIDARVKALVDAAEAGREGGGFYDAGHEWMDNSAPPGKGPDSWDVISGYARNQGTQGNLANGITHINREAVLGPEGPLKDLVRMPDDPLMVKLAREGKLDSGQKIEQFGWDNRGGAPESVVPGGQNSRATQDQRMARLLGYGDDFSGGLTDFQHYYTNLVTNRALAEIRARGIPNPVHGGRELPWDLKRVQAAAWYTQGLKEELRNSIYGGLPFEKLSPELQARAKASVAESFPELSKGFENYISSEAIPAEGSGHRTGLIGAPPEVKAKYTEAMSPFDPKSGRDVYAEAVGAHQNRGGVGYGEYQAPSGNFEQNPNYTTRQLVSFTPGKEIKMGAPAGLEHSSQRMADYIAHMKRLFGVQEAVPMHAVKSTGLSGDSGATATSPGNSYKLSGFKGDPATLSRIAREAGLDVVHRNGEATLMSFPKYLADGTEIPPLDPKTFRTTAEGVLKQAGGTAELGNVRSKYGDTSNWAGTPKGEGVLTGKFLKHSEHEPVMSQAASQYQGLRDYFARILDVDAKPIQGVDMASQPVQTLRGLYAKGGLPAVKDFYVKHGGKGLPAFVPLLLQGGVGEQKPEKHARGGIAGYAGGDIVPQNFTPAPPPYTPGEMPPPTVEEQRMALGYGRPAPYMPPAAPYDSVENTGVRAAEGQTPVGLGTGWDAVKDGVRADVAQGLKGYGELADTVLPSNLGTKYLKPAGEALAAGPGEAPNYGDQPSPGVQPYNGPGSPNWDPNNTYRPQPAAGGAPQIPQAPVLKDWGTGAPQEIATASKAAGVAMQEKAKIEKNALDEMAALQQRSAQDIESFSATRAERYRQRQAISDKMERDLLDAKVNPNQFFESKDAPQKILAGIGMLFSGIGAGLTGQPNLAMDVINRAIDRDIDSQKFNINKNQNYLSYYVKKTGDELIATNYMKADLLDSVAAQIKAKELGMQASTVGPMAQIAYQQLKMQSAELRQRASLQEQQGQINDYNFRMQKMRLDMMGQLLGARPGSALTGDHTQWLNNAVVLGVVPRNETTQEARQMPVLDRNGQPVVNRTTGRPETTTVLQKYWYPDPERARQADAVFRGSETLIPSVQHALDILKKHPAGTTLYRHPQDNAELQQQMAHILIAYEKTVNRVQRQPNEETLSVLKAALDKPGGLTSSIVGSSAKALETVLWQVNQALQAERNGAYY